MNTEHLKATLACLAAEPESYHQGALGARDGARRCVAGYAAEAAHVTMTEDESGTWTCSQTYLDSPAQVTIGMSVPEVAQTALALNDNDADAMFTPLPSCRTTSRQFTPSAEEAQAMLKHAITHDAIAWHQETAAPEQSAQ